MEKCRNNLGDTGFLPPPGGEQAAARVTSCNRKNCLSQCTKLCSSASAFFLLKWTKREFERLFHGILNTGLNMSTLLIVSNGFSGLMIDYFVKAYISPHLYLLGSTKFSI